jgi:phosphoenolpyruvate-protein phosphotransferase (PTS system enzyme I)
MREIHKNPFVSSNSPDRLPESQKLYFLSFIVAIFGLSQYEGSASLKHTIRIVYQVAQKNPSATCIFIAVITLFFDFATGRDIRFPLLYLLPIGLASWMERKTLAYALSFLLPVLRVSFENVWQLHQLFPIESINAAIEILALGLYVSLISRKITEAKQLEKAVTTKDEEMQYLRTFTRLVGMMLQGRGISPGLADGVALVYQPEHESVLGEPGISEEDVESETDRFDRALAASIQELNNIRKEFKHQEANVEIGLLEMRLAMLNDPSFQKKCKRRVGEDLVRIEHAVMAEVREMEMKLKGLKQELIRERSADVRDLGHQVLRHLRTSGAEPSTRLANLPPRTILVAEELLLSDALLIDPINLAAIVTERTGPASHVAILARGRNIPAICDIEDATMLLASGDRLLVDAEKGTVTVAPSIAQADHFATRKMQSALMISAEGRKPIKPCITKDGVGIGLHANIGRSDEASVVLEYNLDGIGLFRSEFLFLEADQPPDLDAQTAAYSEVAAQIDPRPVVIRTMDLGGDKIPRFDRTANNMAWRTRLRGLAYSLSEKTMFRTQILAILRAAQKGNVRIMFPMVMGVTDLAEARCLVDEVLQSEQLIKIPPIGAMIETPAAAFDIQGILQIVDFICIGTNDLTHSILAMDRGSQGPFGILSFLHPSVLKATGQIITEALNHGVEVTVCGEAASDPSIACLLVGMGVRALSMNPFQVAGVRHAIRQVTIDQMEALAKEALSATNPKEIQEIVISMLYRTAA